MKRCADTPADLRTANVFTSEQKEGFIISYSNYMQTAKLKMTTTECINLRFSVLLVTLYLTVSFIMEAGGFGITGLKLNTGAICKGSETNKNVFLHVLKLSVSSNNNNHTCKRSDQSSCPPGLGRASPSLFHLEPSLEILSALYNFRPNSTKSKVLF